MVAMETYSKSRIPHLTNSQTLWKTNSVPNTEVHLQVSNNIRLSNEKERGRASCRGVKGEDDNSNTKARPHAEQRTGGQRSERVCRNLGGRRARAGRPGKGRLEGPEGAGAEQRASSSSSGAGRGGRPGRSSPPGAAIDFSAAAVAAREGPGPGDPAGSPCDQAKVGAVTSRAGVATAAYVAPRAHGRCSAGGRVVARAARAHTEQRTPRATAAAAQHEQPRATRHSRRRAAWRR
ncbi:Protein of unknown function [Gryllus bimaculatus]|nr:Protein of unknown function [Gryllus bimaculatus]